MSKPVTFSVLIRDGQKRCYEDLWASLYRELLWGPDAFEAWLSTGEDVDYEPEELSGMAIVNFDSNELRWGEREVFHIPRVKAAHQRLLEQAWPGFAISFLSEDGMYAAIREQSAVDNEEMPDDRPQTVREAAGFWDDEEDEDVEEDEDGYEFDDDASRAWLTIIDQNGKTRQRNLSCVPVDLLSFSETAIGELSKLKAAEVPPENVVSEGMWIDLQNNQIGFWGGPNARRDFPRLQQGWANWKVRWAENGYVDQCTASDHPGLPMTDTDTLVKFIPAVLSTKDLRDMFGAMGGQLKKKAMQAVGCLVFVLAIPILLIGFFMDKLRESGYIVVALVAVVAIAFKVIELKIKAKLKKLKTREPEPDPRPRAAGPLDEAQRRRGVDQMLIACGFPPLAELESHFPKEPSLDDLM